MNGNITHQLRTPRASEVLAERIRRSIMAQSLGPGAVLPNTDDLIAKYGVGRATVREALRMLETGGLVRVVRGRDGGVRVHQPSPRVITRALATGLYFERSSVAELFDARLILEPHAARLAALKADSLAARELESWVVLPPREEPQTIEEGVDFHDVIARACGNSVLMFFLQALVHLIRFHTKIVHLPPSELGTMESVHTRLAKLILDGAADDAARVMRAHIDAIREFTESQHGDLRKLSVLESASSWIEDGSF